MSLYETPSARPFADNPFIGISSAARLGIVVYFLIWRVFPAFGQMFSAESPGAWYPILIALTAVGTQLLLLVPFLLRRFCGSQIGWLHPLIFPTVLGIALSIIRAPQSLLAPLAVFANDNAAFSQGWLEFLPLDYVLDTQLKLNALNMCAIVATYLGFSFWGQPNGRSAGRVPFQLSQARLLLLFGLFLAVVLFFVDRQGGVIAHIATLSSGRFRMRQMVGHFLVLNEFLPYLLVLLYLCRPSVVRNPFFLAAFALACVLQFVVTGSRSSLFTPVAVLLGAWMFVHGRLPAIRGLILGVAIFLLFGVLGEIRSSGREGQVDFSGLLNFDVAEAAEATQADLVSRGRFASLAVIGSGPELHGHLWGRTYVAAIGFWIPRSIWPDKPRGAGAHVAALLFAGHTTMDGYEGGGYPPGATAEAYWNFGVAGVVVVFMIFGGALRFAANWLIKNPKDPIVIIFLLLVIFKLGSPETIAIVGFFQSCTLLLFTYLLVRTHRLG